MEIITLQQECLNLDCPVTGEYILRDDEPVNEDAKSLMGYWIDMVFEDPFIKSEKLRKAWEEFSEKFAIENEGYDPEFDDFESFITNLNWDKWVCYKLIETGMACGPNSTTVWKILDLGVNDKID